MDHRRTMFPSTPGESRVKHAFAGRPYSQVGTDNRTTIPLQNKPEQTKMDEFVAEFERFREAYGAMPLDQIIPLFLAYQVGRLANDMAWAREAIQQELDAD